MERATLLNQLQLLLVATSVLTQRGYPSLRNLNETTRGLVTWHTFLFCSQSRGGAGESTQVVQACD